jgi:hypothetical protein
MMADNLRLSIKSLLVLSLTFTHVDLVRLDSSLEISNQISEVSVVSLPGRLDFQLILVSDDDAVFNFLSIRADDHLLSHSLRLLNSGNVVYRGCLVE